MPNQNLKGNILEATIQAFQKKGLKFTMDDLASLLGISKKTIYTVFPDKKIRIKGSILEKGRICRMHRLCKKYRKPWNSRFYHAVDKQSCIYLLQQYSVECRWRYLHISHDNRIERSPIG